MANRTLDVAAWSPKVTGGLLYAPLGTALPTNETSTLNAAFKPLGKVGEDGIQPSGDAPSTSDIGAWGGDIVATLTETKAIERYTFTLIGYMDADINTFLFGSANVVVTPATTGVGTKIAIQSTGYDVPASEFVFEMNYAGKVERRVIPNGLLVVTSELPLVHTDLAGYECEVTALPNSAGVKSFRYLANNDGT